ncbi:RNA polymerase II subunit A C-terminal domain phosphatase [Mycena sanguinolenta]|uniref:protein-serine/threonine phosphatase n=1 Tax=Mycena sanguinolenta TaxID=230812 RepID=A0A8H6YGS6_9AGAR|nr:RNA polymerase II subunit A C-terminal domain phosphatase [Mycena sanguinolenta]
MANTTVQGALSIHGQNPQFLVETVIRNRIWESQYWKEHCFALTAESIIDKAIELKFIGGVYGGNQKPTDFLSLLLKLLQIQPEKEILVEYMRADEFKYLRALAAFYIRMTFRAVDVYELLEPLLKDFRKLRYRNMNGYSLTYMDEFVDQLLTEERVCDIILPRLTKRSTLEENGEIATMGVYGAGVLAGAAAQAEVAAAAVAAEAAPAMFPVHDPVPLPLTGKYRPKSDKAAVAARRTQARAMYPAHRLAVYRPTREKQLNLRGTVQVKHCSASTCMASSSVTELFLPQSFPYPIKVVSLDAAADTIVQRGTRLLSYSFDYIPAHPNAVPEPRFGTWDSALDGTLQAWKVRPGEVISQRKAKDRPVALILEECKHGMQISGLCVLCGKDMTNSDYIGFADSSRAHIQMTHSANGPLVSLEEAQRLEKETAEDLLRARKLSLIVDLDQTIVHATVDPTVGEWRAEGAAWKARQTAKNNKSDAQDDDSDSSESEDECNPNWEALEDVGEFRLGAESFGLPAGKSKKQDARERGSYVLHQAQAFLDDMATKYQMHVYTMGTRAYAEQVCALIDPTGRVFGGRLLSRDESGSLTQKSLQRLFPCDTSMVVIIDDRADVWEWSPNLIKVVPYDFFVGIGDINSAFLPKIEPLTPVTPPAATSKAAPATPPASDSPPSADPAQVNPSLPAPASPAEAAQTELTKKALLTQNSIALEAQVEDRPLAKKQEELEVASDEAPSSSKGESSPAAASETPAPPPKKHHRKAALLKNDDNELQRLGKLLDEVHRRFFTAYEARTEDTTSNADVSSRRRRNSIRPKPAHDVTLIIPRLRAEVFDGVHILFSSVIPLDTNPETTEIWRMARMFGAKCSTELTANVTHVVAAKRGTVKVDAARKRGGIKIVWLAWFTDCIALWKRQDEAAYLLDDAPTLPADPVPASTTVEEEVDDEGWDTTAHGEGTSELAFDAINWNDINDEVDAAMNESDDDEEEADARSAMSEEDWTDDASSVQTNSGPSTPTRQKRKRMRSLTPGSADGVNGSGTPDSLGSPLAKRKKVAAERTGASKLKEAITAKDLPSDDAQIGAEAQVASPGSQASSEVMQEEADEDEEDGDDEEDDFLARELEEEWG